METVKPNLDGLFQTLLDKQQLFKELYLAIEKQMDVLNQPKPDVKVLDKSLQLKERLYMKIEKLDRMINEHLMNISKEQKLGQLYPDLTKDIELLMDALQKDSLEIEKLEKDCKVMVQKMLGDNRSSVKNFRQTKGVINQYNKNMGQRTADGNSYFMDRKK